MLEININSAKERAQEEHTELQRVNKWKEECNTDYLENMNSITLQEIINNIPNGNEPDLECITQKIENILIDSTKATPGVSCNKNTKKVESNSKAITNYLTIRPKIHIDGINAKKHVIT